MRSINVMQCGLGIPSKTTYLGEGAFSGCHVLENVSLPGGLIAIPDRAFESCINLKSILKTIRTAMF